MSVESGVLVSSVVDSTGSAVRFKQAVVTHDFVTNSLLSLFLDVVSVGIVHSILEFVVSRSLEK